MLTSEQISQQFSAQGQMFQGQNMYAQQIGVSVPQMRGGQGFDYGNTGITGPGMSTGNKVAGSAISALGTGAAVAGTAAAFLPMLGGSFSALTPFTDPFSMAMGGWGLGGRMGLGMMGKLGMGALGAGIPLMAMHAASSGLQSFVHGAQQQQHIQTTLGQNFNFFNPNARGGQGFSRDDAQAIGDQIRQLAHVPELMTSVSELTKMIPKLKHIGMMQGVKDAAEFNSRFKEAIYTIRDVSKMLGTTMEEASKFFAQSRGAGFFGRQDQLRNVMNAQFTSGITGMSMGSVMQMQRAGADMGTAMGGSRRLGATAVTNTAQLLGSAIQEGRLSEEAMSDLTGMEGAEGVQAGAQQMTQMMVQLSQTPMGRLVIAGLMKRDEKGKAVLDQEKVKAFKSGKLSVDKLKQMGMSLSNNDKLAFHTQSTNLALDFAGKVGLEGMGQFVTGIAQERFGEYGEGAVDRLFQLQGFNYNQTEVMKGVIGTQGMSDERKKVMASLKMREAQIKEQFSPRAIWEKFKKKHLHVFADIEQAGSETLTEIGRTMDEVVDDFVGRHVATMTKEGMKAVARSFTTTGKREMSEMLGRAARANAARGSGDGTGHSGLARAVGWGMSLGDFSGEMSDLGQSSAEWVDSFMTSSGRRRKELDEQVSKFGVKSSRGSGADEAAKRYAKLVEMGQGEGAASARSVMFKIIERIKDRTPGFESMSDFDKGKLIESSLQAMHITGGGSGLGKKKIGVYGSRQYGGSAVDVQHEISQSQVGVNSEEVDTLRNYLGTLEKGGALTEGMSKNMALIASLATNKNRSDRLQGDILTAGLSQNQFEGVRTVAQVQEESVKQLKELLSTSKEAGDVLSHISEKGFSSGLAKAMANREEVVGILNRTDISEKEKVKKLANMGIEVGSERELEPFKKAVQALGVAGEKNSAGLQRYIDLESLRNVRLTQQMMLEVSDGMQEGSGIQAAAKAFGASGSKSDYDRVQAEMEKVITAAIKEDDPKKRDAIFASAGRLGEAAQRAYSTSTKGLKKRDTAANIGAKFGLTAEEVDKVIGGNRDGRVGDKKDGDQLYRLDDRAFKTLREKAARAASSGAIVAGGGEAAAGAGDKLLNALLEIDTTMKKVGTIMLENSDNYKSEKDPNKRLEMANRFSLNQSGN